MQIPKWVEKSRHYLKMERTQLGKRIQQEIKKCHFFLLGLAFNSIMLSYNTILQTVKRSFNRTQTILKRIRQLWMVSFWPSLDLWSMVIVYFSGVTTISFIVTQQWTLTKWLNGRMLWRRRIKSKWTWREQGTMKRFSELWRKWKKSLLERRRQRIRRSRIRRNAWRKRRSKWCRSWKGNRKRCRVRKIRRLCKRCKLRWKRREKNSKTSCVNRRSNYRNNKKRQGWRWKDSKKSKCKINREFYKCVKSMLN